ncbi:MAG: GGDEF domain-containing protein [Spirochaetes bacterium]|nr:GGDEF domain-containing protein [Spirochaetota bacterium]
MNPTPSPRRIALLTTQIDNEGYSGALIDGVAEVVRGQGHVLFVCSAPVSDSLPHYLASWKLLEQGRIDGFIVAANLLNHHFTLEVMERDIMRPFLPAPVVSFGIAVEGLLSVVCDNRRGISDLVDHLVHAHGRKRFVFMKGHEGSSNGQDRLLEWRAAMDRHGLPRDDRSELKGNYNIDEARARFAAYLDGGGRCDAVVCANDSMALGVLQVCGERGLKAGFDLSVTGFDNRDYAALSGIPIATVNQPVKEMASTAARMVLDALAGESGPLLRELPAFFIPRPSCGCHDLPFEAMSWVGREHAARPIEALVREQAEEKYALLNRFRMLRRAGSDLLSTMDNERLFDVLVDWLPRIGSSRCLLALYEEDALGEFPSSIAGQQGIRVRVDWENGRPRAAWKPDRLEPAASLLAEGSGPFRGGLTLYILPLFFNERRLGTLILHVDRRQDLFLESLRDQLSAALYGAWLIRRRREAEEKLRAAMESMAEHNQELSQQAHRDELTAVYNRRGFFDLAREALARKAPAGMKRVVFLMDLDGLKPINDLHGHKSGDVALLSAARLLREGFRQSDLVGRLGGDEFAVLTQVASLADLPLILERLAARAEAFNAGSGLPFRVGMSFGTAVHEDPRETLEQLLARSDAGLYAEKRRKKGSGAPPVRGA